jgi:hemoglobin
MSGIPASETHGDAAVSAEEVKQNADSSLPSLSFDEAHHRVSAAGFKYYVTEMVCWATGGPQNYTGRSMSESHKHLKITESEWAAFCKDFDDTMAKFNVPEAEHKELFAIVESTKGDIVSAPSSS